MATAYKVLGQLNPSATTLTTLYTVPGATSAVVSSITVANLSGVTITYRVAIRPAGAAINNKHYIVYDASLPAGYAQSMTLGLTLATTDVVSVYASTANVAFNIFGSEIT